MIGVSSNLGANSFDARHFGKRRSGRDATFQRKLVTALSIEQYRQDDHSCNQQHYGTNDSLLSALVQTSSAP
jgi:hypothetical protein